MKTSIGEIKIFVGDRERSEEEKHSARPVYVKGVYPPNDPAAGDESIKDRERRSNLRDNQANLCVTIQPGDSAIGDLYIGFQYEGKAGRPDPCMDGQNRLFLDGGKKLVEILKEITRSDSEWEFDIVGEEPKNRGERKLEIVESASILLSLPDQIPIPEQNEQPVRHEQVIGGE